MNKINVHATLKNVNGTYCQGKADASSGSWNASLADGETGSDYMQGYSDWHKENPNAVPKKGTYYPSAEDSFSFWEKEHSFSENHSED